MMRYSLESIKNDVNNAMKYFSHINKLHIQGGETFLYSDLSELLEYICKSYSHIIGSVQIATNGSIISDDKVLSIIRETDTEVRISDYKNEKNIPELVNKLEENSINYRIYKFASWLDLGDVNYISPNGSSKEKILDCPFNQCYALENGLIGRCARSVAAVHLQNFTACPGDYLDIRDTSLSPDTVWEYFNFISPMTSCRHCWGGYGAEIEAAVQISK